MRSVTVCLAIAVVGCGDNPDLDRSNRLVASKHVQKLRFGKLGFVGESPYQRPFRYTLAIPQHWKLASNGTFEPRGVASGKALMRIGSSCDLFELLREEREEHPRPLDDFEKDQWQTCFLEREPMVRNWTDEDWYKAIDATNTYWGAVIPVLRDERSSGRRIVVTGDAERQALHVFWWRKGAPEYFECSVSMGPELIESMAAFEQACKSVIVRGP